MRVRFPRLFAWPLFLGLPLVSALYGGVLINPPPAEGPSWWRTRGVLLLGAESDDYAVLNQGQLKQLASAAVAELNASLPGGAGSTLATTVAAWTPPPGDADDYAAVNQGQLKYLASLIYDRLATAGLATGRPWEDSPYQADDYALANQGQAKMLFNFDVAHPRTLGGSFATTAITLDAASATGYQTWIAQFPLVTQRDYLDAPAGDGVSNLLKYALGLSPAQNAGTVLPTVVFRPVNGVTHAGLAFQWPVTLRPELGYQLETTTNFSSWSVVANPIELSESNGVPAGFRRIVLLDPAPFSGTIFFRLRVTLAHAADPTFLTLPARPTNAPGIFISEGVRLGFDLSALAALPGQIRLYSRPAGSGTAWTPLGRLRSDSFRELLGVRFFAGSAVWLPDTPGTYEIFASALDADGTPFAGNLLSVNILADPVSQTRVTALAWLWEGAGPDPVSGGAGTVSNPLVTSGPISFSIGNIAGLPASPQTIGRVEYYDNGELWGVDYWGPNYLTLGHPYFDSQSQLDNGYGVLDKNLHAITVKVYTPEGLLIGTGGAPYYVRVDSGNRRPLLTLPPSELKKTVVAGSPLTITATATDPDANQNVTSYHWKVICSPEAYTPEDSGPLPGTITVDTSLWPAGQYQLKLWVTDSADEKSYPRYIEVEALPQAGAASLPVQLAAAIVDPATITISNVNYRGVAAAATTFSGGLAAGLEMDEGVVLTAGLAEKWNAGNLLFNTGSPSPHPISCIDIVMARQAGDRTHDLGLLDFDFQCISGQLEVAYQFGSEEYVEYIDSYNDAIQIQINGRTVSLNPDAEQAVAVNTVHRFIASSERAPANPGADIAADHEYLYFDNTHLIEPGKIEYDGMVVKLKAYIFLSPNPMRRHHARLGVADTKDRVFDTALFIKKQGFTSSTP
jgi:hypothetical protein